MTTEPSRRPAPDDHGARNRGERLVVIANPRAGGGRAGAERDAIHRAVDRAFEQARVVWTEGPGHASELAGAAAREADIVAALGGDGTCSEVVNGLVPGGQPVNRKVVFATLPFGTGGDLVRSLEVPKAIERALWIASTGMTLPLDIGLIEWDEGKRRVFVNVAGVGANADVCRRANASDRRFGGTVTFLGAVLGTLRTWTAMPVRWSWQGPDGNETREVSTLGAFCANGHYCGAGMRVGSGGSMADGLFELTILPEMGIGKSLSLLPRLYDGRLGERPEVVRVRAHTVTIDAAIPLEGDGETLGVGPVRMSVLHRALNVRGGWLQPPRGAASLAGT